VPDSKAELKPYFSPTINKLTPQQAKALFIAHASTGDQGVKDVMDILLPDTNEYGELSPRFEGERTGAFLDTVPQGASQLFMKIWVSIYGLYYRVWVVSIKGRFYRLLAN
jgi:hypothetical protein